MLKPEQAKTRLAEWAMPEGGNRVADSARLLPPKLRDLAEPVYNLMDDNSEPPGGWEKWNARRIQAVSEIERLPASERAQVFGLVAPALASAIEGAWRLLRTTPYQSGYGRKAFRAPQRPELSADVICDWCNNIATLARFYRAAAMTADWLAAWGSHIIEGYSPLGADIGVLLAAVLNEKHSQAGEIFETLRQSLTNQHEIGGMGRHVYTAFLLCDRPEAWELIEKMLLAAQRQEGLRQAILEAVDLAHPEAFRRMLRLILDHDLIRFSSVVRAVDVWFGQQWSSASAGVIKKMLTQVVEFLEHPTVRRKALGGKDAEAAFLALWCAATEDAIASVPLAETMLAAKSVELRYVAARHLANLGLDEALIALIPAIGDGDLRVAKLALACNQADTLASLKVDDRFERIEQLMARVPEKPQKLRALVWPWTETTIERSQIAGCLLNLGSQPATRLIPYLAVLDPDFRFRAVRQLIESKPWEPATRQAIVDLAGDAGTYVRQTCLDALAECGALPSDIVKLEGYLNRKSSDLRRGVLALLFKQNDVDALVSSRRLLAAKDANQRLAGLELLRLMTDGKRAVVNCRQAAAEYQASRKKLTKEEQSHLQEIVKDKLAVATLDDALGLMNPADRTPVVPPRKLNVPFTTPAAVACLRALDDLVHEHREATIQYKDFDGHAKEELLGNAYWGFQGPIYAKPRESQLTNLPLADVWTKWHSERGRECRDKDGLELVRALIWTQFGSGWQFEGWNRWVKKTPANQSLANTLSGGHSPIELRYAHVVHELLEWFLFLYPYDARDYLLDALETAYALVPATEMTQLIEPPKEQRPGDFCFSEDEALRDWRATRGFEEWSDALSEHLIITRQELTRAQTIRRWQLLHWRDEPVHGAPRRRVDSELLMAAYANQAASLADLADDLLAPRGTGRYSGEGFGLLSRLTARKRGKELDAWLAKHPEMQDLVNRAVARILELELSRGDACTAATGPAFWIGALRGADTLCRILRALGKAEFKLQRGEDRRQSLSQLAKITFPAEGETSGGFVKLMKEAVQSGEFPEERVLQLAFLAPQWTKHVEVYFGWNDMSEGVYWFLAHMRYVWGLTESIATDDDEKGEADDEQTANTSDSAVAADGGSGEDEAVVAEQKKLSAWERLILERTPLTDQERNEGAIDVAWFKRTHEQLGDKRWQALAAAARFAANASQAKRAQFIADVLRNKVKRQALVGGIKKKQLKDHVRLLGLLPLAPARKREADLIERCRVLREYRQYANQLSGLTKPAALRAWEIGMKNLAQTAGYADPLRLEWAIGADAVKDLAKGPVAVTRDGVTVELSLDELSKPQIIVRKGEKELKSIPPAVKKDKKVVELTSRVTDLKRQAAGIRQSLEAAMCRGDNFTGDELRQWCAHALLVPLISRLVIIGEGILGYPDKGGKALRDYRGKLEPVKPREVLRVAHAHDLLETGVWQDWQRECFQVERVQPFKQVFRELYVVTNQEKKDVNVSHRYDAQQVQPKQALALFGNRGWNTNDGVFKVFHDAGLTANVYFQSGVTTPLEVEGATLAGVSFTPRNEWKPIPLPKVPSRLFSEVMRDLDLVVSIAHAGRVDPEASASTVEMRAGLLRETCALLKLKNVRLKPTHAMVDGELASYSVHLGSGIVHKMPGGSLCIVPVHAQHRGRLFLPFADDDPRTAEVVSKVLLLARDREIQDPTILEQIRR